MDKKGYFNSKFGPVIVVTLIVVPMFWLAHLTWETSQERATYQVMLADVRPYQRAVERCFAKMGSLQPCQPGLHGVPPNITRAQHHPAIRHLTVKQGQITLVPRARGAISRADTYVLTPQLSQHQHLVWHSSGGGVEHGYAN